MCARFRPKKYPISDEVFIRTFPTDRQKSFRIF